jgi:hypothetical protein
MQLDVRSTSCLVWWPLQFRKFSAASHVIIHQHTIFQENIRFIVLVMQQEAWLISFLHLDVQSPHVQSDHLLPTNPITIVQFIIPTILLAMIQFVNAKFMNWEKERSFVLIVKREHTRKNGPQYVNYNGKSI